MKNLSKTALIQRLDEYLQTTPLPDELWVFAYGSLLWDPDMQVVETRPATVKGYCRGFNLLSTNHRGTLEHPGLVLSLRPGNYCEGLVMRIDNATKMHDFTKLWLREMITMFYLPTWLEASTPAGNIQAITFVANPSHSQFVDYNTQTTARMIASASGGRGKNIDYFYNTWDMLKNINIQDSLLDSIAEYLPADQNSATNKEG